MTMPSDQHAAPKPAATSTLKRWGPLGLLAGLMALAFAMGWHNYLSFKTIGVNYDALKAFVADNLALALLAYVALYVAVVALSLPGGLVMTLAGGLLFGVTVGSMATVVAATLGATILFLIAKTSFGESLAARAGPWLAKLRAGFQDNALSYLLFLRLVPAFPFVIVNLAPALLGVPLKTYVLGTFFGIIPGTVAFSFLGAGLGSVVEAQNAAYKTCLESLPVGNGETSDAACPYTIDTAALITPELIAAFVALGLVALVPVALKKWKGGNS